MKLQQWDYAIIPFKSQDLEEALNDWGEKGWELVSTHYFRNKDGDYAFWDEFEVQCIFKRFLISRKEHEEFSEEIAEARKLEEKDS